ncbi:glycosyltransferase family 2 protein [Flavobacterium daemonense]|uniref:glycosyltransferase family 2 protein n=1 Tax=Flavobacterium daemonense TaxID=1393049 RepID=UPI001184B881|nr:glycosyltransferase family 2 protein [Flavobacterium daemonense]KAF2333121.1 glycosyltransferase family 2 protein [Flavobacterium daemonense]
MELSLVSIIIPAFNRAHLISETLDSVLAQTYIRWECIIVDDGSTDHTADIVEKYVRKDNRFQYHIRPETHKSGGNGARNYGFGLSNGDFVIWLDSDDLLKESCLQERVLFLKNNSELDFAVFSMGFYCNGFKTIDENREVVNKCNKETLEQFLYGKKLPWQVSRPLYRKEVIEGILFNEDLQVFQDDEYNIKILNKNPNYKSIDITDCYYRIDEDPDKLTSKESFFKIFPSLFEYYKSVFSILEKDKLEDFELGMVDKFYHLVRFYHKSSKNNKTILKTLQLFHKQFRLNYKTRFKFWSIVYLNSLWYNKRGHYRLIKQIDKL